MNDETMKSFLESMIKGLVVLEDSLKILLHNYQETIWEENNPCADAITVEQIRTLLVSKVREGKEENIKKLLNIFQAEKLSEVQEQYYQELFEMAKAL